MKNKQKFTCDGCGEEVIDIPHKSYNENHCVDRGIKLCTGCKYGEDSGEEEQ